MKLDSFLKEKQWKLIIANIAVFILGFILFYLVFIVSRAIIFPRCGGHVIPHLFYDLAIM